MYDPSKPNKAIVAALIASIVSGLTVLVTEYSSAVPLWVLVVAGILVSSLSTFLATYYVRNPTI
jgi:hypothetical protein